MNDFEYIISKIQQALAPSGVRVIAYETTGSTNLEAKMYAADTHDEGPVLFIAKQQSSGRGRLGRSFLSRSGSGIYMTLLYFTRDGLCDAVTVTTSTAVAAALSITEASGEQVKIKWINDIYSERGKVAGILVETVPVGDKYAVAVGIGINVGAADFPEELHDIAASLAPMDADTQASLVTEICSRILEHAKDHKSRGYMSEYRRLFMLTDKKVQLYRSGEPLLCGTVKGVDDDGALLILPDKESVIRTFSSGEITVRLQN